MQQPKIALSTIDEVLRFAEEAPALNESEVTKTEAMRRIVPALKAMQAKGYGMGQIARLLSERGIAITELALRHYMCRHGGRSSADTPRPAKRERSTDRAGTGPSPKPGAAPAPTPNRASTPAPTAERQDRQVPAPTHPRTSSAPAGVPSELSQRAPNASGTEPAAMRGGFVVRPDRPRI
jgi:hypothetical protein